jgi:maleate cis-trans isomerase
MEKYVERLLPKFRYGDIAPRGRSGREVMRGMGYDFYQIVPTNVMVFTTVMGLSEFDRGSVEKAIERYEKCVAALLREKVDCIILGGVPISAQLGRQRVLSLLRGTEEKSGVRCDGPLESLLAAMKHLGLKSIAVGSRWVEDVNQGVRGYIEEGGCRVVGMTTRGQWGVDSAAMSLEQGMETALEVGREAARLAPDADAIFVPGGAAISLHTIPALEEEFGKPAFNNLNVEVWNNLIRPRVIPAVHGWGTLLASGK